MRKEINVTKTANTKHMSKELAENGVSRCLEMLVNANTSAINQSGARELTDHINLVNFSESRVKPNVCREMRNEGTEGNMMINYDPPSSSKQ